MSAIVSICRLTSTIVAGVAALFLGVTFTHMERQRVPILAKLDQARLPLFVVAIGAFLLGQGLELVEQNLTRAEDKKILAEIARRFPEYQVQVEDAGNDIRSGYATSLIIVGTERFVEKDFRGALENYAAADQLLTSASLKAKIADCYFELGKFEMSILFENEAIALAPDWSGPPYGLAHSYLRLNNRDAALAAAKRSCALGFDGGCKLRDWIIERE